jgi:hypothetical protein
MGFENTQNLPLQRAEAKAGKPAQCLRRRPVGSVKNGL